MENNFIPSLSNRRKQHDVSSNYFIDKILISAYKLNEKVSRLYRKEDNLRTDLAPNSGFNLNDIDQAKREYTELIETAAQLKADKDELQSKLRMISEHKNSSGIRFERIDAEREKLDSADAYLKIVNTILSEMINRSSEVNNLIVQRTLELCSS